MRGHFIIAKPKRGAEVGHPVYGFEKPGEPVVVVTQVVCWRINIGAGPRLKGHPIPVLLIFFVGILVAARRTVVEITDFALGLLVCALNGGGVREQHDIIGGIQ